MSKGTLNIEASRLLHANKNLLLAIVYVASLFLFPKPLLAQPETVLISIETPEVQSLPIRGNNLNLTDGSFSVFWQTDSIGYQFRYRLIPHSDKWCQWSEKNSVSYFNLKEGTYFFVLELSDGKIKELTIHIDLPIWKNTLFYIGGIVLISFFGFLLIVILFRQRIRKITYGIEEEFRKAFRIKQKAQEKKTGDIAHNVKEQARIRSRKYKKVTVLFADIQGFTKIVEHINPETLIDELDRFFFYFDGVVEKYNIEKIKTIGDAYMCAGGIPTINRTNPVEVV